MNEPTAEELAPPPFVLRALYLRESHSKLEDDFNPLLPGQRLQAQFSSSMEHFSITYSGNAEGEEGPAQSCQFSTKFELLVRVVQDASDSTQPAPATPKVAATITACIVVDYLIKSGAAVPSEEILQKFGSSHALVQKWPYWREYCHSTIQRMHLPHMMVPLLVVPHRGSTVADANLPAKPKLKTKRKVS